MKRTIFTILALLLACCVLAGCGAAAANGSVGAAPAAPQENYDVAVGESTTASDAAGSLLPEAGGRKLVYTASLDLETKTYPDARDALLAALDKAGGYVESNEEGGSAERGTRWSRMTLRVPADRYAAFLAEASGVGNLVNKQEQMEDITASYVDVQARLDSLETQRARLTELMEQAENLTDLLQIQQQLSDVEYQIESYTAGGPPQPGPDARRRGGPAAHAARRPENAGRGLRPPVRETGIQTAERVSSCPGSGPAAREGRQSRTEMLEPPGLVQKWRRRPPAAGHALTEKKQGVVKQDNTLFLLPGSVWLSAGAPGAIRPV